MVRSDFQVIGRDEEEYVLMFAQDLDVGFITGRYVINQTFVLEIEPMAVPGGTGGVILFCNQVDTFNPRPVG